MTEAASRRHRVAIRAAPSLVSVIMPVRDAAATIAEQLEALSRQTYAGAWEVVIADNRSRDATGEVVSRFADRLRMRWVDASARIGISPARNEAFRVAAGELVLFCDADDVVADDWLDAMVQAARHADLVGGRLVVDQLNPPVVRASRPQPQPHGRLAVAERDLPFATGASLGIWADALADLGGFDDTFKHAGDDIDLCWRAQLAGYRLVFAPEAVVHYRYRQGVVEMTRQAFRYGLEGTKLYRRHRGHLRPRTWLRWLRRLVGVARTTPAPWRSVPALRRWCWELGNLLGRALGWCNPRTWTVSAVES